MGRGKGQRAPRKPKAAPPPERTEDEDRELFLSHRGLWNTAFNKLAVAQKNLKDIEATARGEGYPAIMFKIAHDLCTQKGEVKVQADVTRKLKVAKWIGHSMGNQLDMFAQPDRTPIADKAYDQGKMASMENKPNKPPYAPSTEAYAQFMDGYNDHQTSIVSGMAPKPEDDDGAEEGDAPPSSEWRDTIRKQNDAVEATIKETAAKLAADSKIGTTKPTHRMEH